MSSPPSTASSPSRSPSPSPSPRRLNSDDDKLTPPSPQKTDSHPEARHPPPPPRTPAFPGREDCWSEEATRTLIDAWGGHYLELNRGNLRRNHWQEVADAVNSVHAVSGKLRRTDVQCKNRIDTTKKKYKVEKTKVVQSHGRYVSSWPHFESLDALIGDSFSKTHNNNAVSNKSLRRRISPPPSPSPSPSPPPVTAIRHRNSFPATHRRENKDPSPSHPLVLSWSVPVGPRSKRSGAGSVTERNFSVIAAAAAAMEAEQDDEDGDGEVCGARFAPAVGRKRKAPAAEQEGYRMLAEAIIRLGQIYEKVEVAKQRQMVEFEKQRFQFAKDLEILRTQVQLDSLKRAKHNSEKNSYL